MEELILELKTKIIEVLNLEEMTPEDIDTDSPLFGAGLGLDSIDALELIVLLEKAMASNWPILQKEKLSSRIFVQLLNM